MPLDAAFLDRDGTINVSASAGAYVTRPADLQLYPGAAAAVRRLNDQSCPVILVTNQRGIALGVMSHSDLAAVHRRLDTLLADEAGAHIDAVFYCPHDYDECSCRKPLPGLLLAARQAFPTISFSESIMIGDSPTDAQAAAAVGVPSIRIGVEADDLAAAVEMALRVRKASGLTPFRAG